MSSDEPDLHEVYAILREWAMAGTPQAYGDWSRNYQKRTSHWFEPHGSWDAPLGKLNERLADVGAPGRNGP